MIVSSDGFLWHSFVSRKCRGGISFARLAGYLITVISCLCYVAAWEVIYIKFMPDFLDKYAAHMIEGEGCRRHCPGDSGEDGRDEEVQEVYNSSSTPYFFTEPFPVDSSSL
jgi:hypothetical protein